MSDDAGEKKNILIVEDHPVMRNGLAAWFAGTGRWNPPAVTATVDGAMEMLLSENAARSLSSTVILLDIQLDGAWGLDLLPRLRERLGGKTPPCVVYSAFDDQAHLGAALSAGARGYVCKKSDEAELEKALLAVLAGGEYIERSLKEHLDRVSGMVERLTRRESEIWSLAREGLSARQIGRRLGISPRTVNNILSIIYDKTGLRNRKELEGL